MDGRVIGTFKFGGVLLSGDDDVGLVGGIDATCPAVISGAGEDLMAGNTSGGCKAGPELPSHKHK